MKNIILCFCLFAMISTGKAQSALFVQLKKTVHEQQPELDIENKLVAYTVWSISDLNSREVNKSFGKTWEVYRNAKLKGGSEGIVVVAINKDNLDTEAKITLTKDGVSKMVSINEEQLKALLSNSVKNAVFDSSGNEVYRNLEATQVYSSINKLITR